MTPIVWSYDRLTSNPLAPYIELNPVMHFVEILREPLLGQPIVGRHWAVVGGITVLGCGAALVCLRNYRARVAYWV
jgi:ABC-2 type transport system permease protein